MESDEAPADDAGILWHDDDDDDDHDHDDHDDDERVTNIQGKIPMYPRKKEKDPLHTQRKKNVASPCKYNEYPRGYSC